MLKNGSEEGRDFVVVTMELLQILIGKKPIVFDQLVMRCQNENHQFFGSTAKFLKKINFVDSKEYVYDSIRNIVLSAIVGEGLEISLESPFKG